MDEKDIEVFLQAKRENIYTRVYAVLAIALLVLLIFMETIRFYDEYTIVVASIAVMVAACIGSPSRMVKVTRVQLLEIIEKQINRDEKALQLLVRKQSSDA